MDRKIIMGVAAVAGIGLLLYLRKSGDSSAIGASGSMLGAAAAANNWASQPYVITTNTKAPAVVDNSAKSPVTTTASTAAPVFGGGGGGGSKPIDGLLMDGNGNWIPADQDKPKPYAGATFAKSPNTGQSDRDRTLSIMGY